jgi:hypothetical protein
MKRILLILGFLFIIHKAFAVEIIIKNTDSFGTQSDFEKGDILYIAEDGHNWSDAEQTDSYSIIYLPGVSMDDTIDLLQAVENKIPNTNPVLPPTTDLIKQRRYYVDLNQVSPALTTNSMEYGNGGNLLGGKSSPDTNDEYNSFMNSVKDKLEAQ